MSIVVKAPEKVVREQLPAGNYQGVCYMVRDIGTQVTPFSDPETGLPKKIHQVVILYEIDEQMTEGKYAGKRFVVNETLTLSFHEKAKLLQRIEGWFGRELSEDELNGFDLESLIGMNCMVNIVTNDKGYAKVASVSPLMKKMTPIIPENAEAPKWVEEKWEKSEEMQAFTKGQTK
jgi:hypothetical protein